MGGDRDCVSQGTHDRVVAGMCHRLNSQLAAANGYLFLLRRRERLGEFDEALQREMDEVARSIHLLRSLCVGDEPHPTPVSLAQITETASEIMEHHPYGPVRFVTNEADAELLLRVDWAFALRGLMAVGEWIGRELDDEVEVRIRVLEGTEPQVLRLAPSADLDDPSGTSAPLPCLRAEWGFQAHAVGSRAVDLTVGG